ncbi:MAG: NAD-dependent epimerase/dehydratase family protein [Rhodovibrionaceae bacterium]|nr:NAD-dependent epimerase/dehydratase family protein [Rhodovibrionaceae bacterium]
MAKADEQAENAADHDCLSGGTALVTGGAGFIGGHLVAALAQRGCHVRSFDLAEETDGRGPQVERVRGDVRDPTSVDAAMKGVTAVFHLAANAQLWARDKAGFDAVNHQGTVNVLRAASRAGVKRIVHTSTEAVLVDRKGRHIVPQGDVHLAEMPGPYCRSKYRAEAAARAAAGEGLPVVIVNPTVPLGPGDRNMTPPTRMLSDFLAGRTQGVFLDFAFNAVDARDAAQGHILAAEKGRVGTGYVLGGRNLHMAEFLKTLETVTGRRMPRRRIPGALALGVAAVSEFAADRITRRPPSASLTGVRLAMRDMRFDDGPARRELGYATRPLEETLKDAVAWLRARQED